MGGGGEGFIVSKAVLVTDEINLEAYSAELRAIFMAAFEVPLSAVILQLFQVWYNVKSNSSSAFFPYWYP